MAFGRSNSLSLNTTAVNNSFAQQQSQQPTQPSGSLFGSSLFGNQQKPNTTAASGTGLFGTQTTQASQPAAQPAAQPSTLGGSFFGSNPNQQPGANTSLFGQSTQQPPAKQSLFGQQPANTSLFGQPGQQQSGTGQLGGSLFGQQNQNTNAATTSLFGASTNNAGLNASTAQPNPMQTSLLGASRYAVGQPAPYTGRLSMGQGNAAQTSVTPATKLNWDNVRSTTRFDDLVDTAKDQLEAVDRMIKQQETFCKQIEAFLPVHTGNLESLAPDINLIKDKVETAEQALVSDAQGVQASKALAEKDHQDVLRCERIGENLRLPSQYHYAPAASKYGARKANGASTADNVLDGEYDIDLVGNYFVPMAAEMQKLLETYQANLGEIESHLQTIEGNAIAQARSINQQRAGASNSNEATQQLVDTLRDFEGTILNTAAKVGTCREGITDLTLRRARAGQWRA